MKTFNKPTNLNGAELRQELRANGIEISDDSLAVSVIDNLLQLDIKDSDESLATIVVAAHNGTTSKPEPTIADKLAAAGLTVDELKSVLGLN